MQVIDRESPELISLNKVHPGTCYKLTTPESAESLGSLKCNVFVKTYDIAHNDPNLGSGIIHSVRLQDGLVCFGTVEHLGSVMVETLPNARVDY